MERSHPSRHVTSHIHPNSHSQSRVSRLRPKASPAASTAASRARAPLVRAAVAKTPSNASDPMVTTIGLSPDQNFGVALFFRLAGWKSSRSVGAGVVVGGVGAD